MGPMSKKRKRTVTITRCRPERTPSRHSTSDKQNKYGNECGDSIKLETINSTEYKAPETSQGGPTDAKCQNEATFPRLLSPQKKPARQAQYVAAIPASLVEYGYSLDYNIDAALTRQILTELKATASKADPTQMCHLVFKMSNTLVNSFIGRMLHVFHGDDPALVDFLSIDIRRTGREGIFQMLKAMRGIHHRNLGCFYDIFMPNANTIWIMCRPCTGSNLLKASVLTFHEPHIATICREVCKGLEYLHSNGIVHRNLQPSSITVTIDGEVKLRKFLCCTKLTDGAGNCGRRDGPVTWMAPEMISGKLYGAAVDIWSLGITILYIVGYDSPFFEDLDPSEILTVIMSNMLPQLDPSSSSPEFRDFLSRCLCVDASERASATDLLEHEFLKKAGPVSSLRAYGCAPGTSLD